MTDYGMRDPHSALGTRHSQIANRKSQIRSWMRVVAPVLGRGLIREHFVVDHVVGAPPVDAIGDPDGERAAQVADQRADGDVHDVITETPPIGPAAGNGSAIAEWVLDGAVQHVAPEDAQA